MTEDLLGLEAKNVMAIEDNFNDMQMLQYAGLSVAIGNAPSTVREMVDWVAPEVDQNGVTVAIQQLLLR